MNLCTNATLSFILPSLGNSTTAPTCELMRTNYEFTNHDHKKKKKTHNAKAGEGEMTTDTFFLM